MSSVQLPCFPVCAIQTAGLAAPGGKNTPFPGKEGNADLAGSRKPVLAGLLQVSLAYIRQIFREFQTLRKQNATESELLASPVQLKAEFHLADGNCGHSVSYRQPRTTPRAILALTLLRIAGSLPLRGQAKKPEYSEVQAQQASRAAGTPSTFDRLITRHLPGGRSHAESLSSLPTQSQEKGHEVLRPVKNAADFIQKSYQLANLYRPSAVSTTHQT